MLNAQTAWLPDLSVDGAQKTFRVSIPGTTETLDYIVTTDFVQDPLTQQPQVRQTVTYPVDPSRIERSTFIVRHDGFYEWQFETEFPQSATDFTNAAYLPPGSLRFPSVLVPDIVFVGGGSLEGASREGDVLLQLQGQTDELIWLIEQGLTLTVPAGTFDNVIRIRNLHEETIVSTLSDQLTGDITITILTIGYVDYWLAPDVGIIQLQRERNQILPQMRLVDDSTHQLVESNLFVLPPQEPPTAPFVLNPEAVGGGEEDAMTALWQSLLGPATTVTPGQLDAPWLGRLAAPEFPWFEHPALGWTRVFSGRHDTGLVLYSVREGWLVATEQGAPHLFRIATETALRGWHRLGDTPAAALTPVN